jgi:hypothetical protein
VRLRDHADDREPEPCAGAVAARGRQREPLEGMGEEVGREPRPFVPDVQLDRPVHGRGSKGHAPAAVPERIVDEIP